MPLVRRPREDDIDNGHYDTSDSHDSDDPSWRPPPRKGDIEVWYRVQPGTIELGTTVYSYQYIEDGQNRGDTTVWDTRITSAQWQRIRTSVSAYVRQHGITQSTDWRRLFIKARFSREGTTFSITSWDPEHISDRQHLPASHRRRRRRR
jgi:hypothetical protein